MPIFFSVLLENTMSNTGNHWRLIAPLVSGFGISMICPMSKKYRNIQKQQPPSYVFKIVWPILYLLLGYSWNKAYSKRELDLLHGFITFLLTLWIIVFSCMKDEKHGIYIIALTIATIICCMSMHDNNICKMTLIPLLAWLLVAFQLNWNIVES